MSPQTPVPPSVNGGVLIPPIAGQSFAPMPPFPPSTNNHDQLNLLAQEPLNKPRSQSSSDDTAAATLVEVDKLYERMSNLAKKFLDLFDTIPRAGLERELSGKPFQGLVVSRVDVYKDPSTWKKSDPDHLDSGKIVRVFAEKSDPSSASDHVWYRISGLFRRRRYISSESVINLYQMLQCYFQLATQLWEAVAANRFEEVINPNKTFQKDVLKLEDQLIFLQNLCHNQKNPEAKESLRWRRRIQLYRHALEVWRHCLDEKPSTLLSDPTECGRILYRARGYLGLGSCNLYEYILIKSLQTLGVLVSRLLVLFLPFFMADSAIDLPFLQKIVISLAVLLVSYYLLWFSAKEPSISVMIGYALMRKQASNATRPEPESKASSQNFSPFQLFFRSCMSILRKLWNFLLRWWLRLEGTGVGLSVLIGIVVGVLSTSVDYFGWIDTIAGDILGVCLVCLFAFLYVVFPFTLTMQVQMSRELRDHPQRPPEARRFAMRPAMKLLSFNTICCLIITIAVLNLVPAFKFREANVPLGSLTVNLGHQIAYVVVVVWLYWRYLGGPYRRGLRHWKTRRLGELAILRTWLDRRLSQVPSSSPVGKEPSSVQDDYTLWEYYRAQEEDVKRISLKPFTLVQRGGGLLITLISAVLSGIITNPAILSQAGQWLSWILQYIPHL